MQTVPGTHIEPLHCVKIEYEQYYVGSIFRCVFWRITTLKASEKACTIPPMLATQDLPRLAVCSLWLFVRTYCMMQETYTVSTTDHDTGPQPNHMYVAIPVSCFLRLVPRKCPQAMIVACCRFSTGLRD